MWIERACSDQLLKAVKTRPAVLLTGMRQSGKSSLLKRLFPEAVYVTLDDMILAREANEKPKLFLKRFENASRVIIDEIQYAPDLLRELKIIIDENRDVYGKWVLTGSQRFSLMNNISESLAGRISIIELSTLSAVEIKNAGINTGVENLVKRGGFPELWKNSDMDSDIFFRDYLKTYIERDVRSIVNIGDLNSFQKFIQLLALRSANILNLSELAKDASISPNTAKSWVSVLESSGVISIIQPYFENIGKRLIKSPKVFFCDTGLLCNLLRINGDAGLWGNPLIGQIWENFVVCEIIKTVSMDTSANVFYYRDSNGVEIDVLVIKNNMIYAVEAKSAEKPDERKFNFDRVLPLLKKKGYKTQAIVAAPITHGRVTFEKYIYVNPGIGSII